MNKSIVEEEYGNKVRLRVCGICLHQEKILLIKHTGIGSLGYLWAPPGGAVEYGQDLKENLKREFLEETMLRVSVDRFLGVQEYLRPPLHAVEVYFKVTPTGGTLALGHDPELNIIDQILSEVKYFSMDEINSMKPKALHQIFRSLNSIIDLESFREYGTHKDKK